MIKFTQIGGIPIYLISSTDPYDMSNMSKKSKTIELGIYGQLGSRCLKHFSKTLRNDMGRRFRRALELGWNRGVVLYFRVVSFWDNLVGQFNTILFALYTLLINVNHCYM